VKRVGVFVDEDPEEVKRLADNYSLDYIQLHGHETPEVISYLRTSASPHPRMIKAFNIATEEDLSQTLPYEGLADLFLFDTKGQSVGGNGEKFNWDVLDAYQGSTPFLLSGGIGPDDAAQVNAFRHPKCIGIDLNSRFELSPGLKDIAKLKEFICNLNTEI
jgi:phosphoribosylanthranilate isomerase